MHGGSGGSEQDRAGHSRFFGNECFTLWEEYGISALIRNGISALIRRSQRESELSFHHVRTQLNGSHLQPGRGLLPEPDNAGTLIPDFLPPEM